MQYELVLFSLLLSGCASTFHVPSSGTDFSLDGCPPLLNCVSSTSSVFVYQVEPIRLSEPLDGANWQAVRSTALELPGASLNESRFGYLDATFYSAVLRFPDFFEVLVRQDQQTLDVRSQSMIGLYDLHVNRKRVETFRQRLVEKDIALPAKSE